MALISRGRADRDGQRVLSSIRSAVLLAVRANCTPSESQMAAPRSLLHRYLHQAPCDIAVLKYRVRCGPRSAGIFRASAPECRAAGRLKPIEMHRVSIGQTVARSVRWIADC